MTSSIFNSLGANYDQDFRTLSRQLLFSTLQPTSSSTSQLISDIEATFLGKAQLFYKARQAITWSLKALGIKSGDHILTQAFTCYAVEEGINAAGAIPAFVDTELDSLNLSTRTLQATLNNYPRAKAVIVQHTLGEIAPIKSIANWCHKHKLLLIEDLAHSYGALDPDGRPVGYYADAVILSFGRDKMVDAISGGAAIIKNLVVDLPFTKSLSTKQIYTDLLYPQETHLLQQSANNIFGKLIHRLLKKTPLLTTPIKSSTSQLTTLPAPHAQLVLHQLATLGKQLLHRQKIARLYTKHLSSNPQIKLLPSPSVYLRFPIIVDNRHQLLNFLKQQRVFIADTWYRQPVETGSLKHVTSSYVTGTCPQAEYLSSHIINLPTHINITKTSALRLTKLINQFYA